MFQLNRITIPPADVQEENIHELYPTYPAWWIMHPQDGTSPLHEYRLELDLADALDAEIHLTADARYEWSIDGKFVGMGPDRSDEKHWSFASYQLHLDPGKHQISVRVLTLTLETSPGAQHTIRHGFLFAATDPVQHALFDTGIAPWKVRAVSGIQLKKNSWMGVTWNAAQHDTAMPWADPLKAVPPCPGNSYGCRTHWDWRIYPSELPEQIRKAYTGTIKPRALITDSTRFKTDISEDGSRADSGLMNVEQMDKLRILPEDTAHDLSDWAAFTSGKKPLTIPAHTELAVLFDFETYLCVYPEFLVSGASDALITPCFTESLYDDDGWKKNRSELVNKLYYCDHTDRFTGFDSTPRTVRTLWWRAGRYLLLLIRTGFAPLTLHGMTLMESRYPLEPESEFHTDDPALDALQPMMITALQACSHETYMDCPYYEQLMYDGDTRLEMLATFNLIHDSRLPHRAVDLFDWSRSVWDGLTAERYPSPLAQLSCTFSMIWAMIVRDFMMYRGCEDPAEFRKLRNDVRSMLLTLSNYSRPSDGLLENLPGWSFVDWVPSWYNGVPATKGLKEKLNQSDSHLKHRELHGAPNAIFSLFYLNALKAVIELEDMEPSEGSGMKEFFQQKFDQVAESVRTIFYDKKQALFADDAAHTLYCVHDQCLALLAGILPTEEAERCLFAMIDRKDIDRPTVSFAYYYFEALQKMGYAKQIYNELGIWKDMAAQGAVTTWESPEPTRSDCHAWGAHALHHFYASFAGIRPASPKFRTVSIKPEFGPLKEIKGKMVHPLGMIEFEFHKKSGNGIEGRIVLPEGCSGKFSYQGFGKLISGGETIISRG